MSKTSHTWPSWLQAVEHIARGRDRRPKLPRIIVHPPKPGDVHLLDKRLLVRLLPYVPIDYRNGLKAIELRARTHPTVGHPYGTYNIREKIIRLYCTPAGT